MEKWQLANKFSVSKVNCDGNTLPSVCKKRVDDFTIFFKSAMYLLKTLPCKLNTVSNILKSKESPRVTFEYQSDRIYRPGFIHENDHVRS